MSDGRTMNSGLTLSALQLREALDFVAPDFATDAEQRESEVQLFWADEGVVKNEDGEVEPAGYFVFLSDYPEEGCMPLGATADLERLFLERVENEPAVVRTAPQRIWLQVSDDASHMHTDFPRSPDGDEITWSPSQTLDCEVEYLRVDLAAAVAPSADVATLRLDLARAHDSADGFIAEIKCLKQQVRELQAFKAMVNRHQPEFPADPDGPRDVWYWQGDGEDHLESMVHQLPVVIRAEQLRELLATKANPLTLAEVRNLSAMQAGAPWSDDLLQALVECVKLYEQCADAGIRPFDPADLTPEQHDAFWERGELPWHGVATKQAASEPNEWHLPADLKAGHVTFRKGVHCSALVLRMTMLHEAVFGVDNLTPEQKAENLAALQAGKPTPHPPTHVQPKAAEVDFLAAFEDAMRANGLVTDDVWKRATYLAMFRAGRAANVQPKGTELPEADIRAGFRAAEDAWTFKGMTAWQVWLKACRWFESRVAQAPAPAPATEPFAKVGHHEFVAARNEWKATVWTTTELPTGTPLYAGPSPAVTHSKAAQDVLAERQRQISVEGWTPEHDDEHGSGCMAFAAAAYAAHAYAGPRLSTTLWNWTGWSRDWWKPKNPRADLIRAGALILAEIERLDRAPKPPVQGSGQ
jgi:hypothetical protein